MARYDKYDPKDGGFRAPLDVAIVEADAWTPYGVGLNAAGRVVLGGGTTGVVGLLIAHGAKNAGDIVDVMTDGEVVEFDGTPGRVYGGAAAGGAVAVGAGVRLGHTVEAERLIVRVAPTVTAV